MKIKNNKNPSWSMLYGEGNIFRLLFLCFGVWLYAADSTLIATLIPIVVEDIGGIPLLSWAYTLFQLGSVVTGAIAGLIVIRIGIANSEIIVGILYLLGCAISSFANDMPTFVFGRLLQGMGGGGLVSLAFIGGASMFPKKLFVRVIAIMSGFWGISSLCGPLIGGFFANIGNWRGAFWAFCVQGIIFVIIAAPLLNKFSQVEKKITSTIPFARLCILGLSVLLICQAGTFSNIAISITICIVGIMVLAFFIKQDSLSKNSIFPRGILNPFSYAGSGLLMISSFFMATISFTVYGPLLMHILFGVSPLSAGYIIALQSIGWTVLAILSSGILEKTEKLFIRLGAFFISISSLGLVFTMPMGPIWLIAFFSTIMGMGFGMSWSFVSKRIITSLPENERVQASGSIPTFMRLSMALGSAFSGIIANFSGFSEDSSIFVARNVAFWCLFSFLPLIILGIIFAWRISK